MGNGRAVVEEVLSADIGDGTVYVYRIEPDEYHSGDADFTDFYIATYKTSGHLGKIWGWGETPEEALENAEMRWDDLTGGYANPFKEALETLKEEDNNLLENY